MIYIERTGPEGENTYIDLVISPEFVLMLKGVRKKYITFSAVSMDDYSSLLTPAEIANDLG